jgi:hypothetical protein
VGCQHADWIAGHGCVRSITFLATGYLMGTTHHSVVRGETYESIRRGATVKLTEVVRSKLWRLVDSYIAGGAFHPKGPDDVPRCCDSGATRFIINDTYAAPEDVPKLAKLFLEIDPLLASLPGGLYIK